MKSLHMLNSFIAIAANAFILYYVVDMEKRKCDCSDSWMRDYIKIVSSLIITFMVLMITIPNLQQKISMLFMKNILVRLLLLVWTIIGLVYVGVILTYYYRLNKDESCDCSENWKRYALLYPLVMFVISFVISFLTVRKNIKN